MTAGSAGRGEPPRGRGDNPFPGLRPFESGESSLFFGRDEQCDDLLVRLGRRRLVAVVGMSGSGKSSLVRAGLLPALDRGYLPSAGSSWQIAVFRPGSDPVANLTRALVERRRPVEAAEDDTAAVRAALESSSLGLVEVGRTLLTDGGDSLLVIADQFEELFRFGRLASRSARDQAAACVDLLINASQQDEVPVYVVLTMRSDYLGDCAHFIGLPEALNDSQFLVPKMTRAQLRAAIESPVAVRGARITPRVVQRLLYDVEHMSASGGTARSTSDPQDQDQLPVLQHALMRVWEVSRADRDRGEPIDLRHYEAPPVETLSHALDRHAEEVYQGLPADAHRNAARLMFQRLTERDAENREVRRPTPLRELAAVALRCPADAVTPGGAAIVNEVVEAFSEDGRAFVVVNAQQDVDISHESFIRKWERLRDWVEQESRSRRVYMKLAEVAASWDRGEASLYRGPELAEARQWWQRETPTPSWAERYDARFAVAQRFLARSTRWRGIRLGLLFGNAALLVVGAVVIAALMVVSRNAAKRAETAALDARNAAVASQADRDEAARLRSSEAEARRRGDTAAAEALREQALLRDAQANSRQVLTPGELGELERLRKQEGDWKRTEAALRQQIAAQKPIAPAGDTAAVTPPQLPGAEKSELDRLRKAEAAWEPEKTQLQQQLTAANDRASRAQQAEAALRKSGDESSARPAVANVDERRPKDRMQIEELLRRYAAAYERLDAQAVARLVLITSERDLARSFSQLKSYKMSLANVVIDFATDSVASVTCTRTVSVEPKVGTPPSARTNAEEFVLAKTSGAWTIVNVIEVAAR